MRRTCIAYDTEEHPSNWRADLGPSPKCRSEEDGQPFGLSKITKRGRGLASCSAVYRKQSNKNASRQQSNWQQFSSTGLASPKADKDISFSGNFLWFRSFGTVSFSVLPLASAFVGHWFWGKLWLNSAAKSTENSGMNEWGVAMSVVGVWARHATLFQGLGTSQVGHYHCGAMIDRLVWQIWKFMMLSKLKLVTNWCVSLHGS